MLRCGFKLEHKVSIAKNKEIEEMIKQSKKEQRKKVKILLLGTGDTGKSTFLKQMKMLLNNGFATYEISQHQHILQENCLVSMQIILTYAPNLPKKIKDDRRRVLKATSLQDCADCIQRLWGVREIRDAFKRRNALRIQVPANSNYYFENVSRIASQDYVPTSDDIFRSKNKTSGILEVNFHTDELDLVLIDVGGQRAERRKWIHSFDDVTTVIYLVALDDYNNFLEEDNTTNRLEESLKLFQDTSSSKLIKPSSWILFLNKCDIFKEKIKNEPLSEYFGDISEEDSKDFDSSCKFIKGLYENVFGGKKLYTFVTCALDTNKCKMVWNSVRDTILVKAFSEYLIN